MEFQADRTTPLWDVSLPAQARIDWLLRQMTLEEKLSWLTGGRMPLERLGVPGFGVGGEAAHGVEARNDQGPNPRPPEPTTSFPQPIGMSATWDPALLREAGMVTGVEARVLHHRHLGRGLSRWAPTVDLERDPRWGRNEEGYGEDPFLTGEMASGYVRGMRGDDPRYIRVAATLKHFYANNTERGRAWKNASMCPRNRYELYIEPFRRVIQKGGAEGIMTAYNRINGVTGILNPEVQQVLKDQYGLQHAVGDGGAMSLVANEAHACGTHAESLAAALHAGVDSMSDSPVLVQQAAREAWELGLITEADLDRAISNVMHTKLKLGLYDAENRNPYDRVTEAELCCEKHAEICRRVSREAVVLMKNEGLLPLKRETGLALIGPLADRWDYDWYGGEPPFKVTLKQGLAALRGDMPCTDGFDRITLAVDGKPVALDETGRLCLGSKPETFVLEDWGEGSYTLRALSNGMYLYLYRELAENGAEPVIANRTKVFSWFVNEHFRLIPGEDGRYTILSRFDAPLGVTDGGLVAAVPGGTPAAFTLTVVQDGVAAARQMAAAADTVVLALGCQPVVNAKEEIDRRTIELPPRQQALLEAVTAVNPKTAVVLLSNYPYAFDTEKAPAILWSATGAQDMGAALAETLLGLSAPAGRLNQTWYVSDDQLPSIDDYDIIRGKRTYRYFDGPVLFPFGHGLTYTTFAYEGLTAELADEVTVRLCVTVRNTGDTVSDEVVQLYAVAPPSRVKKPLRQLVGFRRLKAMQPGEARRVEICVPVEELRFYDVISRSLMVEAGEYTFFAGRSSADEACSAALHIPGGKPGLRDLRRRTPAECFDDYTNMLLTEGRHGFAAAAPVNPAQPGLLVYGDADAATLTGRLVCHLYSAAPCRMEVLWNGSVIGQWQGDTLDYKAHGHGCIDQRTRNEQPARVALQTPKYANVIIPLQTENLPREGAAELALRITGPAKLCWLRCEAE